MHTRSASDTALMSVLRNSPISEDYAAASFVASLYDDARFDAAAYVELESALATLIATPTHAAQADRHVFAIYRLVATTLLCHLNPSDVAQVGNLDDDAVIDLKNQFDYVVGCYFCREPFEPTC